MNTHGALTERLTEPSHTEGKGREGKGIGREVGAVASILTVGAHDAPAISRPDVDEDACPIEHLDFEPMCDSLFCDDHAAEVIALTKPFCDCASDLRLWCRVALKYVTDRDDGGWQCTQCQAVTTDALLIRWEPLR